MMGGMNPMMANNMMGGGGMMMGNNNMMAGGMNNGMMGGGKPAVAAPAANFDDDFGDFEGVSSGSSPAGTNKSSDPFGSLVSLDGLSKNTKKQDKLNEPIVINAAAAQYMQDKQKGIGAGAPQNTAKSAAMSFAGIDGLPKSPAPNSMAIGMGGGIGMGMSGAAYPASGGMNPTVMGSGSGGNASLIGALDPQMMTPQPQQTQQQGGMTPQQQQQMMQMMMMQNPQLMQQIMMNGGQMTPQQQQQMLQMMMMMNQPMGGGQGGGGMMGGGNNMMGGQGGYMGGTGFGGF